MNLKQRLSKLEETNPPRPACQWNLKLLTDEELAELCELHDSLRTAGSLTAEQLRTVERLARAAGVGKQD